MPERIVKRKIKGRIIRILDNRTVVINLGREHGITSNSIFYILGEPEPVVDPVTKEILGTVNVSKSRVRASQVFDKFTIATTSWTYTSVHKSIFGDLIGGLGGPTVETHDEGELKVSSTEIKPWKAKSESPVKVGDEVEVTVEIQEAEEAAQMLAEVGKGSVEATEG